jgi:signal-transduction protein with cAMP-binding, CBS, and nucleotidyltransferase domain
MDITQIIEQSGLPKEAIMEFSKRLKPEIIEAKDYFIRYGEKMNKLGILYEGVLVSRYSDENGNEIVSKFYFPEGDNLVTDYYSFKNNIESSEEIRAIEKSKMLVLKNEDFKHLIQRYPSLQNLVIRFAEESYLKALSRIRDFQLLNAKDRIKKFLVTHESIVNKVMVKDKASYLGMTRNIFTDNMKKN